MSLFSEEFEEYQEQYSLRRVAMPGRARAAGSQPISDRVGGVLHEIAPPYYCILPYFTSLL